MSTVRAQNFFYSKYLFDFFLGICVMIYIEMVCVNVCFFCVEFVLRYMQLQRWCQSFFYFAFLHVQRLLEGFVLRQVQRWCQSFFFILHFYMYRGFRNDLYYDRYRGGVNLFSSSTFCIATCIEVLGRICITIDIEVVLTFSHHE